MNTGQHYVVVISHQPLSVAASLDAAKADTEGRADWYVGRGELRWEEHGPNEWRLMHRPEGKRRYSWTQYWIAAVPAAGGTR
ncbi:MULTISPECIES: hypothetical protein [Streptomyces]|uniref:Uncharacterized protein n=1 Tax=Streptomyces fradiae ATCC 10745 = DSM 40063 TaxID=1319510 RepID=A0A1Y2NSE8_STRFR|nr:MULTISPECIES: hypothetical protein [Streptomyces]KAF0651335.1 hypothetical protein K701_04180 [Streptomyces fradiae ATCC 10745 = DSM 40063]OSY50404.1 hypothetical protein BG846_03980 [Streptomyces fradiae ATCC 10745 = DSM 40063]QEV11671.1 hypothetical protein CP974_06185 [Streptomyces fradiae ATCC 10745 = DSM 40063]